MGIVVAPSVTAPVFTLKLTEPEVPPPVSPVPAVTFVMSPTLLVEIAKILSLIAAEVIKDVSLSTNDSVLSCKDPAASSEVVSPETFSITEPEAPPPVSPVPAVTFVMSPTFPV